MYRATYGSHPERYKVEGDEPKVNGYTVDEIEQVANELVTALEDMDVPHSLMILSLAKAIADIGTDSDLDNACVLLDRFVEINREEL